MFNWFKKKIKGITYTCINCIRVETDIPMYKSGIKIATMVKHYPDGLDSEFKIYDLNGIGCYHYEDGTGAPYELWLLADESYEITRRNDRIYNRRNIINQVKEFK